MNSVFIEPKDIIDQVQIHELFYYDIGVRGMWRRGKGECLTGWIRSPKAWLLAEDLIDQMTLTLSQ